MKKIIILASLVVIMTACSNSNDKFDATGTFEATENIVSAEQNGKLISFLINEGELVEAGFEAGLIDTMQLYLQIQQLQAQKAVFQNQKPDSEKQLAATREQLQKARLEQKRYQDLLRDGATSEKTVDDINNQVKVLERQLDAQQSALQKQLATLSAQVTATDAQIDVLQNQLSKCHIVAPVRGTVLEKYAEQNELAVVGKPLFKIADIENMYLKAYITSSQLTDVKIGQKVRVFADFGGNDRKEYDSTITWISQRSEFTPKTILTNDERADLVYAIKIAVKNDGYIKIGMYGEMKLK
ncbi:MAG: HlyD family efflux transporter periplasmic adaptor subunit [Paludibacteraceae bacterium]|nr:HlyD family efflux transporter periplasmic adaptor subunit [Paludibacteraceae bacterium]